MKDSYNEPFRAEMRKCQHMIDMFNLAVSLLFFPALIAGTIVLPLIVRLNGGL